MAPFPSILVVMAKEPCAGSVKTRLCPPLSAHAAAVLYEAMVGDTLERLAGLGLPLVLEALGSAGGAAPRLAGLAGSVGATLRAQSGADLGARMASAAARALGSAEAVVLMGGDSPDLPLAHVRDACVALGSVDVCIGPSEDGGYYLLGCRSTVPPLFDVGVPWGTASVLEATLHRVREAGLSHALLDPWYDVDAFSDVVRLRRSIEGGVELPRTSAALTAIFAARSG